MSGLPWFKCDPRALREGMIGLTREERGTYITLLTLMYERGGPVPDLEAWMCGHLWCSADEWKKDRAALILKGKLTRMKVGGKAHLFNKRAEEELSDQAELRAKLSAGGKKRKVEKKPSENNDEAPARFNAGGIMVHARPAEEVRVEEVREERAAVAGATSEREQLDQLEGALRQAGGSALNAASPSLLVLAPILRLLNPTEGEPCSLEADVLPAVRACAAKQRPGSVRNWGYFVPAILEARDRRLTASPDVETRHDRQPAHAGPYSGRAAHPGQSGAADARRQSAMAALDRLGEFD